MRGNSLLFFLMALHSRFPSFVCSHVSYFLSFLLLLLGCALITWRWCCSHAPGHHCWPIRRSFSLVWLSAEGERALTGIVTCTSLHSNESHFLIDICKLLFLSFPLIQILLPFLMPISAIAFFFLSNPTPVLGFRTDRGHSTRRRHLSEALLYGGGS